MLSQSKYFAKLLHNRNFVRFNCSLLSEARENLKSLGDGKIHLDIDEKSGISLITIDNELKRNALSGSMMVQLEAAISKLEDWHTGKGVILKSRGNIFCSGGDTSRMGGIHTVNGTLMSTFMHQTLMRLFNLPLITVCLVNGRAMGGGAELTTATDFRVFSTSGQIHFVQGKMGLVPGWAGATRLVKILGFRTALDLISTSQKVAAEEALRIGLADHIIEGKDEKAQLQEATNWLCERLIHHHTVIQDLKKILVGARDLNFEDSLAQERKIFANLWGGPLNLQALNKSIKH